MSFWQNSGFGANIDIPHLTKNLNNYKKLLWVL
jgi:hypothetical protein